MLPTADGCISNCDLGDLHFLVDSWATSCLWPAPCMPSPLIMIRATLLQESLAAQSAGTLKPYTSGAAGRYQRRGNKAARAPFLLFRSSQNWKAAAQEMGLTADAIGQTKAASTEWNKLSADERAEWAERARAIPDEAGDCQ